MTASSRNDSLQFLEDLASTALKQGADSADALCVDNTSLTVGCRMGKTETLDRSESADIGLRVLIGKRQAIVSTTDRSTETLRDLVNRAVAMARLAPEDPFCGLAEPSQLSKDAPTLDLDDHVEIEASQLVTLTKRAEDAMMTVKGVTLSDGAEATSSRSHITLAASNGFHGQYTRSTYGFTISAVAGEGTEKEAGYDYAARVFWKDMPDIENLGRTAGENAVKRLGARKMPTGQLPVVFDRKVANGLLRSFVSAINGAAVARGTSYLKDCMGQRIFPEAVTITDDPFKPQGLRSRPFDVEGLQATPRKLIDNGVLTGWIMDLRSARQLGLNSTGHASRGTGGPPSPSATNVSLLPGPLSVAALMKDIKQGFYVTDLMGSGVDPITGDYSQGAAGFWIENGTITFPVSEMSVAGQIRDMFMHLTAADDLQHAYGIDCPTLRIEGMTVAGV
ncbi:MAG: TldD/PmbA family protein [Alphaproteobacteria bacterium]|nr:TldD/PmbA family protein [Alphaproteobacteria bacterium]MBV8548364.1 TldD/PmbA family protein [Alphaproteobacteria bacterium]